MIYHTMLGSNMAVECYLSVDSESIYIINFILICPLLLNANANMEFKNKLKLSDTHVILQNLH